jgi:hypothetical protein
MRSIEHFGGRMSRRERLPWSIEELVVSLLSDIGEPPGLGGHIMQTASTKETFRPTADRTR